MSFRIFWLMIPLSFFSMLLGCEGVNNNVEIDNSDSSQAKSGQRTEFLEKIISQVAVCRTFYEGYDGETYEIFGLGFIINGSYFATCYHIYKRPAIKRIINMVVKFNMSIVNQTHFDTVSINLNYKAGADQYDFAKHPGDTVDRKKDFVILKLAHHVECKPLEISKTFPRLNDSLFSFGFKDTPDGFINTYETAVVVFASKADKDGIKFPAFLGTITTGSSGCPVFNSKGEAIGISSFGFPEYEKYRQADIGLSPYASSKIELGYLRGLSVGMSVDIRYLLNIYAKGYN